MATAGTKTPTTPTTPLCWFSKLTTGELSLLLRACGAPASGNDSKAELVARLRAHPVAAAYAAVRRAPALSRGSSCALVGGRDGLSVADIKQRCRQPAASLRRRHAVCAVDAAGAACRQ
jgi:hypothetical protein